MLSGNSVEYVGKFICSRMLNIGWGRKWSSGNFCVNNCYKIWFVLVWASLDVGLRKVLTVLQCMHLCLCHHSVGRGWKPFVFSAAWHHPNDFTGVLPLGFIGRYENKMYSHTYSLHVCTCVVFCVLCVCMSARVFSLLNIPFEIQSLERGVSLEAVTFECIKQQL